MFRRALQLFAITNGQRVPTATVYTTTAAPKVTTELFGGRKVILFGVPGAFTPGCSKTHLPGYVQDADKLKAKLGVSEIFCVSVNDPFVMAAWGEQQKAEGKVTMISDPQAAFVSSLGLTLDLAVLGGKRSSRFAMILNDGVVEKVSVEPDGKGLTCSLAASLLQ